MTDYDWGKVRSWHLAELGSWTSLCGRPLIGRARIEVPLADEKTCERCFQIREARIAKEKP